MSGAGFDEYEYLEQQMAQEGAGNGNGPSKSSRHKEERRDRDVDRDREKDRDRSRRRRSRSRSRSRRHRSKSAERRHKRPASPRHSRREKTPPEVRLAKEKERELRELERATRTVFAYNLNIKADERDLFEFFAKAGKITDIRLIMDRNTRKSKGLAYIEFSKQEEVFTALSLTGSLFLGQPVLVKSAEAEKNLAWEAQQQAKQSQAAVTQQVPQSGPCKLQVLGLHPDLTETDLKPLFEPFGNIDSIQIMRDGTGKSLKYGYISYQSVEDANKASAHWNGKVVADSVLAVSIAATQTTAGQATTMGELDEDEENLKLSAQARTHLMNRLASSAGLQAPAPAAAPVYPGANPVSSQPQVASSVLLDQGLLGPASPIPTPCVLLKNMFDPQEVGDPEAEAEIREDVAEECSKFGKVLHCFLDKNSKGFVYLKFETVEAAMAAAQALHGRWYSGHQIVADYQFAQVYNNFFKC